MITIIIIAIMIMMIKIILLIAVIIIIIIIINNPFQPGDFSTGFITDTDSSVNVGNQELSSVYLSICALLLICASIFPIFLNVKRMSFLLFPETIFIFYSYIQARYDKQINKLLINLLLICCGNIESNPGPKK